ncbi:Maebl [Staphylococcus aureus]|nr:Maebl [Staphylococcus aureus]
MTQQQNNKRTLKNKHTYQNEPLPNRKDFVVSFITGALVGSALGLYFKNKVYQKADDLKVKEQELSQKFEERKTQLEETVAFTKESVEGFLNKSKNEQAALKAQQAAIKEEASANNLSDTSLNVSKEESQAERLANAAKQKQAKLTPGSKESQLTEALFAEKPVAKNDLKEIPQLVTKKNDVSETETVNTDNKDTVKQKEAKFENGVITRKADEKTTNNTAVDKKSGKQSKKTTPSNKRMHQKHLQIKLQVRKSNIIRNQHKVLRNKVVQVSQFKRIIKLVIRIQKQQMLSHPMHQKRQMLKLKKLKVK